jgi:hypothetical protein
MYQILRGFQLAQRVADEGDVGESGPDQDHPGTIDATLEGRSRRIVLGDLARGRIVPVLPEVDLARLHAGGCRTVFEGIGNPDDLL